MIWRKKQIKELEIKKQELLDLKDEIEQEKRLLEKMKEILEYEGPIIDVSNVYLFRYGNTKKIVKLEITNVIGDTIIEKNVKGFDSKLIDIFSNDIIYRKTSKSLIGRRGNVSSNSQIYNGYNHEYHLIPIYEVEPNLMAYVDNKVPLYVLQRLYYEINNVDLDASILKNTKIMHK